MAQTIALNLLPQTVFDGTNLVVLGDRQQAASYYASNRDLQTVSYSTTGVTGTLNILASLATDPQSSDWVIVASIPMFNASGAGYINIPGSYVWIRARMNDFTQGQINTVNLSY